MDGDRGLVESGGSADSDPGVPMSLLAQWRAAEERLYPMVMVIPEGYERVVRLVGETTVELQLSCPDVASLVDEAPLVAGRVRTLAADRALGDGLDFALIGAAACLMRFRQLEAEIRREQRIHHISEAVDEGATWVVLEHGAPPTTWPPMPSTTVEMHLASGWALEQTIAVDADTGAPNFALAQVHLDPETGARSPQEGSAQEFGDLDQWRAAIAQWRHKIELGH